MSKKLGFSVLALACMLTITLISGATNVGYCGGFGDPAPPTSSGHVTEQLANPKTVGQLVITSDSIVFVGFCKNEEMVFAIPNNFFDIQDLSADDILHTRVPLELVEENFDCRSKGPAPLIITGIENFKEIIVNGDGIVNVVLANITLRYIIPE